MSTSRQFRKLSSAKRPSFRYMEATMELHGDGTFESVEDSIPENEEINGNNYEEAISHIGSGRDDQKVDPSSNPKLASTKLFISPLGRCSTAINQDYLVNSTSHDHADVDEDPHLPSPTNAQPPRDKVGRVIINGTKLCLGHRRPPDKRINAGEDVLATYHESSLYGKLSLSTKARAAIRSGFWSSNILRLEALVALMSLVLYVRSTYTFEIPQWVTLSDLLCGSFFVVDYLIRLYSAPVRLCYIFSVAGLVDLVTTLPIIFVLGGWRDAAAIPRVLLILRVLRAFPLLSTLLFPGKAVSQHILLLTAYTFGIVFIAAGILQWVEKKTTPDSVKQENNCDIHGCMNFWNSYYFIIVTISTVGYGDFTPKSEWGRFIALLTILTAIVLIPVQVNKILELASRRPFGGTYAVRKVVGSRFIVVSGNLSYQVVQDFLSEFYHPSRDQDMPAFPLRIVMLAPYKPSFELKTLMTWYKGRVDFIEGTPSKDSDLERVGAGSASAFLLLADHSAKDPDAEDASQIMRSLSVHRFCGKNVRLIVEMLKPENQDNPIWDDSENVIEIVCPEAISYQLLARSCQIKGASTFLTNLFKSGLRMQTPRWHWLHQYYHGMQQGLYPLILPSSFHETKILFQEAAEIIYLRYNTILIGLDVVSETDNVRDVLLLPKNRIIESSDVGLVIARDLEAAERVSRFGKPSQTFSKDDVWWKRLLYSKHKQTVIDDKELLHEVVESRVPKSTTEMQTFTESVSGRSESSNRGGSTSSRVIVEELREIISSQSSEYVERKEESSKCRYNHRSNVKRLPTKRRVSLEEAVEKALSWPPQHRMVKPDLPILERRAEIIMSNLRERTLVAVPTSGSPHLLLCMQGRWPSNLFHFVCSLRNPSVPNLPIVILHPSYPSACEWGCVGMFEDVYFVRGSPMYDLDLVRAGVLQAEKVVILTHHQARDDESQEEASRSGVVLDVRNVLITAMVERLLQPSMDRVIVEFQRETEIHYLRPKLRIDPRRFDPVLRERNRNAAYMFAPAYIEGKGFCLASLNFLLYSLYFNQNTVRIVEKLLFGGWGAEIYMDCDNPKPKLEQILLPKGYAGRTFQQLFVDLLRNPNETIMLALGLYRAAGTCGSIIPYIYTNPLPGDSLLDSDLVYVISWPHQGLNI